jgi:methylglutaconyl-CoA hydratase
MSGFGTIKLDIDDKLATATLRLNRPDKRNALNAEMFKAIGGALDRLRDNAAVRCVLVRGEGAAFCAGADLAEVQAIQTATPQENQASAALARDVFLNLYEFPKPTIALVHGPALAGGAGLASCCDFILASQDATFGYPEVKIGFIPALVMVLLTHQIGERAARDLCLSGRTVDAADAHRLGLVHQVAAADQLDIAAGELARLLGKNSPQAMAAVKSMFAGLHGSSLSAALDRAVTLNALARGTEDCREGIAAFLEKRKPRWIP